MNKWVLNDKEGEAVGWGEKAIMKPETPSYEDQAPKGASHVDELTREIQMRDME